ncbi:MAG TPA: hypothetical protein VFZ25_12595 [Chloroflexota bacterium]|nr:hypothetical protein [Chloroflexota bacterium]
MLHKLHALVRDEIGEDRAPFSLDIFGTRAVTYGKEKQHGRATLGGVQRRPGPGT